MQRFQYTTGKVTPLVPFPNEGLPIKRLEGTKKSLYSIFLVLEKISVENALQAIPSSHHGIAGSFWSTELRHTIGNIMVLHS